MDKDELEKRTGRCWRDFPTECNGCDFYNEYTEEDAIVSFSPHPAYAPHAPLSKRRVILIKECTKYHKKTTEILD